MNKFTYKSIYSLGSWVYAWTVEIDGVVLEGSTNTPRQAYRRARKAVKLHRKMHKFLNP